MVSQAKSPYDRYDYEHIVQRGQSATATIDALETVGNITINGEHPIRIAYHYTANSTIQRDVFQNFDSSQTQALKPGDSLPIKYYQGQSVVANLSSYRFPYFVFYLMSLVFMVIGLPFLLIGLLPAIKKFNLYKTGIKQQANLISMIPNAGLAARALGQNVLVNYYFTGPAGERIFDKATTPDFSILNHKKPDELYLSRSGLRIQEVKVEGE